MIPKVVPAAPKKPKRDTIIIPHDTIKVKKVIAPMVAVLKADSLITLSDVLFETDSYKLKNEHFASLDSLCKFLLSHPALEVAVTGHTDNRGDEKHNVQLSARRAETVAQYLINKGVADEKIFFEGFGSAKPIAPNDNTDGRSKNRRVEILIRDPNKR